MKTILLQIASLLFIIGTQAQSTFTIGSGAYFTLDGSPRVVLEEMDFVNDGTLNAAYSEFIFRGANWNRISGSSYSNFYDIYLDKIGIAGIYLEQHTDLERTLHFSSGLFDLNGFTLTLGTDYGTLDNETEDSRIVGYFGGEVVKSLDLNAPFAQNPGNIGAEITSFDNLGWTVIRRGHLPQTMPIGTNVERTYDIFPTAAPNTYNAQLKLHYFDAEAISNSEGQITLWKNDGIGWDIEGHDAEDQTGDWLAIENVTDFGFLWTIANSTELDVNIKAFLQGPLSSGLMSDNLRTNGLVPMSEPYSATGAQKMQNQGAAILSSTVLSVTGNNAIVDWVLVELRDKHDPSIIQSSRAALLQRDGDIVDTNGTSFVSFKNILPDDYYIALRHRNHLGVMTRDTRTLNAN